MADVFCNGPFAVGFPDGFFCGNTLYFFQQPQGRAFQPLDDAGENILLGAEIEFPVKPFDLFHVPLLVISYKFAYYLTIPFMENTTPNPPLCSNCNRELPAADVIFCPHCGQKNSKSKASMREFLTRFFEHFTHLDNKFVRTVHDLFVPGKMTEIYFRGKRKRYPNPVQLFFIVMFFFLVAANHYSNRAIRIGPSSETLKDQKQSGDEFFQVIRQQANRLRLRQLVDSLPADFRDAHVRQAIDSLLLLSNDSTLRKYQQTMLASESNDNDTSKTTGKPETEYWRRWPDLDSINLHFGNNSYNLSIPDLAWLTEDELVEKYKVDNFLDRLMMKQSIKVIHNPNGLTKSYFGSFSWTILVLVGVIAAFMMLLYRRQRRYYVEHFVFMMHWHSGVLLLFAFVLLLGRFVSGMGVLFGLTAFWAGVSLFWAMRRYYGGSILGTIWRWLVFFFVYNLAFAVVFVAGLLIVLVLF